MEQLVTRSEHSRNIDDAEKYKALQKLRELGLLIPISQMETYHGRLAKQGDNWKINPAFANGKGDNINNNVNERSTLYAADKKIASEFAQARFNDTLSPQYLAVFKERVQNYTEAQKQEWLRRVNAKKLEWWNSLSDNARARYPNGPEFLTSTEQLEKAALVDTEARYLEKTMPEEEKQAIQKEITKGYFTQVHQISSADTDATIIDSDFNFSDLPTEQQEKFYSAMSVLVMPISEGSPLSFEDRDVAARFSSFLDERGHDYFSVKEVSEIMTKFGLTKKVALQLAGGFNARKAMLTSPSHLAHQLVRKKADIIIDEATPEKIEIPLNLEYVQKFMREAHIVGYLDHDTKSATLGKKIDMVSFFDLERVATAEQLSEKKAKTGQVARVLAEKLRILLGEMPPANPVLAALRNAYIEPKKVVQAAKEIPGYKQVFESDAGNWEGFTLAEHTETVLRNFDENFADEVPVEFLMPLRLAILAHDLGKPAAAASGEKHRQEEYNLSAAKEFLGRIGAGDRLTGLILGIIKGEELAFRMNVRKDLWAAGNLEDLARETLEAFYNVKGLDFAQLQPFIQMCEILQVCDGGAYTSMAVTRSSTGTYRNAPSFNSSFAQPVGLGRRGLKLRQAGDIPAAPDQTPSIDL